jgi:membrane protein implicated in regulation of membrane protease activity
MRPAEIVEQVLILLAIALLWPFVFGCHAFWYQWVVLPVVLGVMALVLVRKWRRFEEAAREAREQMASGMPPAPRPDDTNGSDRQGSPRSGGNG